MPWWDAELNGKADRKSERKGPLVLVQNSTKGTRISAVSQRAHNEGLWVGMKLADARTMIPDLYVRQHDVNADKVLFEKLSHWMLRYSPSVARHENTYGSNDGANGFVLDVEGCTHLFGGEQAMARDIQSRFRAMGFTTRLAFADTLSAAFALVTHGAKDVHLLPKGCASHALDSLPVEALRLEDETVLLLKRLGLKTIRDVRALPRASLERRFRETKKSLNKTKVSGLAQSVQWRLDQLSGVMAEPLSYIIEPYVFRTTKQCPALALEQGAVEIALDELLPDLCGQLEAKGRGARQFRLTGYRADGGSSATSVCLSQPVNTSTIIKRLFKDRLERIDPGFGIDLFVLEASGVSVVSVKQRDMMDTHNAALASASLTSFADTVINRMGAQVVTRLAPYASHVPERAQRLLPVNTQVNWQEWKTIEPSWSPRPLRLFAHPEPTQVTAELPDSPPLQFVWRKTVRKVTRARGPERILPEWWHDNLKSKSNTAYRDYYDVEDEHGRRYWLFRAMKHEQLITHDNDNADGKTETVLIPYWYVHGLF